MQDDLKIPAPPAPNRTAVAALKQAFEQHNLIPGGFIDEFTRTAEEASKQPASDNASKIRVCVTVKEPSG